MSSRTSTSQSQRATRQSISSLAYQSIVIALLAVQGGIGYAVHRGWWLLAAPLVLAAAHLMHGVSIAFHEASHGLLRRGRFQNELDGTVIGALGLLPLTLYRAVHQTHHMHLATERDEEFWPLNVPGTPLWARRLAAALELTLGVIYVPFLFYRAFFRSGTRIRSPKVRRRIWLEILLSAVLWAGILTTVAALHAWDSFFWVYLLPVWIATNLQSWRKYVEHVGLEGTTVNSMTRNVMPGGSVGRFVSFSLLHEPFHGVHHSLAGVPHDELPKHADLMEARSEEDIPPFPNYFSALRHMVSTLGDPRVGVQWLPDRRPEGGRANRGMHHVEVGDC